MPHRLPHRSVPVAARAFPVRALSTVPSFAAFACAALAFAVVPRTARAQLTVNELEVHLVTAGASVVHTVGVRNDSEERVQAVVTIEDWERTEAGANTFLPAGSHARSCAKGLEVFPRSLALEPGATATVRVSFTGVPDAASCWSIVFLENRATQMAGGRQLQYTVRTGVKVHVTTPNAARDGQIESMAVEDAEPAADALAPSARPASRGGPRDRSTPGAGAASSTAQEVAIRFRNAGEVQLQVGGAVEVRRADNSLVHRGELAAVPVLPTQQRLVRSALPPLPAGRYVILALLDFGGSELVAGQLEYEVR
jgi:P pilus assembly chaperone PapD